MMYLRVNSTWYQYVTRESDPDETWDRDDTCSDWSFLSASVTEERDGWDLIVPFDAKNGDTVWVVAAVYSTGDSFGRDDRACVEYIDAFLDSHKARDCARAVEASRKSWNDHTDKEVKWIREDGTEAKLLRIFG